MDPVLALLSQLGAKMAFSTSQYSTPLNPEIRSGASVLPPFRAPQLRTAIQKNSGAVTPLAGPAYGDLTKAGASAPTRGNFMMASDIPAFRAPRLDRAIQKNSGSIIPPDNSTNDNPKPMDTSKYAASSDCSSCGGKKTVKTAEELVPCSTCSACGAFAKQAAFYKLEGDAAIETDKDGKSLGKGPLPERNGRVVLKEKDSDYLPGYIPYSSSDFKRSKYAMSMQDMSAFVAALRKEGSITSPASQLAKTQSIGAPKATAPPGPSIAQIAKPRGARFGIGIPGAFKTRIGGDSGVSLS